MMISNSKLRTNRKKKKQKTQKDEKLFFPKRLVKNAYLYKPMVLNKIITIHE